MRILLGSGGYRTDERRERLMAAMRAHFGAVERILFVPWAVADHDGYVAAMNEKRFDAGYVLDGIHTHADPCAAVRAAEAIYVGGGNTFRLLAEMYRRDVLEPIRERVRAGAPYMGVSAGSNVACPTMQTTNDMPITLPPSFDSLGLVTFQVNAHYYPGQVHVKVAEGEYVEHFGETRDDRIREFHELNAQPVVGLWEGGHLTIDGDQVELHGAPARVFRRGEEPFDVQPGSDLGQLLG